MIHRTGAGGIEKRQDFAHDPARWSRYDTREAAQPLATRYADAGAEVVPMSSVGVVKGFR